MEVELGARVRKWKVQRTRVSADSFDLSKLTHLCCSLNVLEVNILVFAEIYDASEIVKQTFSGLVLLEQIDQSSGAEKIRVLGGNLDDGCKILTNI